MSSESTKEEEFQGLEVLVVDDDPQVRGWFQIVMKRLRINAQFATNGAEGLKTLDGGFSPGLIISDVDMPGVNGHEFAKSLKIHPRFNTIPLIFLTSHDEPEFLRKGMRLGAVDYLSKAAMGVDQLLTLLRKHRPLPRGETPGGLTLHDPGDFSIADPSREPVPGPEPIPEPEAAPDQAAASSSMALLMLQAFHLLRKADIGIVVLSAKGAILDLNALAAKRLGFPKKAPADIPPVVGTDLLRFCIAHHTSGRFKKETFIKWLPGGGRVIPLRMDLLEDEDGTILGALVLIP